MNSPLAASSVTGATTTAVNTLVFWKMTLSKTCRTKAIEVATKAPQPRPRTRRERGSGS